mgnify:FL=1
MKAHKITNRYGDEFTLTLQEDGTILWEGNFEYCRFGMPNDYTKAWEKFQEEYGGLDYEAFKQSVHSYDEDKNEYVFKDLLPLITSKKDVINMVDPSGGPYLTDGMKIMGKTIKEFKPNKKGYLIITE